NADRTLSASDLVVSAFAARAATRSLRDSATTSPRNMIFACAASLWTHPISAVTPGVPRVAITVSCSGPNIPIRLRDQLGDQSPVVVASDLADAERCQVRRAPLSVDQPVVIETAPATNQLNERDFGSIGRPMKHRLAGEQSTDREPVEATDQFCSLPH